MRLNEFAGNLPQNSIGFGCLENESQLNGGNQTEECRRLVVSSPDTLAGTAEIPETDTSAVNRMTVLQSAQPGIDITEGVCEMNVYPADAVQCSGKSDTNVYCKDKFRSLSKGQFHPLAEKVNHSVAHILRGPSSSGGTAVAVYDGREGVVEERGHQWKLYLGLMMQL